MRQFFGGAGSLAWSRGVWLSPFALLVTCLGLFFFPICPAPSRTVSCDTCPSYLPSSFPSPPLSPLFLLSLSLSLSLSFHFPLIRFFYEFITLQFILFFRVSSFHFHVFFCTFFISVCVHEAACVARFDIDHIPPYALYTAIVLKPRPYYIALRSLCCSSSRCTSVLLTIRTPAGFALNQPRASSTDV